MSEFCLHLHSRLPLSFPLFSLSLSHSLTLSLPPSLPPSLTLSLTHSLTYSLCHSLSLTHSLTPSPTHPPTHSLTPSLIHSLPPSLPPSLSQSLIHSLTPPPPPLSFPLSAGAIPVGNSFFASSTGPIFLDDVACQGTERGLSECIQRSQLGVHDCTSLDHAGAICPCELVHVHNINASVIHNTSLPS